MTQINGAQISCELVDERRIGVPPVKDGAPAFHKRDKCAYGPLMIEGAMRDWIGTLSENEAAHLLLGRNWAMSPTSQKMREAMANEIRLESANVGGDG